MQKKRRRKYFVNKPFQVRYICMILVPLILLSLGLYYLMYYSVFEKMLIPEAVAVTLIPAMRKVNLIVVVVLPVALFFIIRTALIRSNRIVGPIPRLEKELNRVLEGDYSVRLRVREKDDFRTIVEKMNKVLEMINKT